MKYYTVMSDDSHGNKPPHYFRSGVPAHRFTKEFLSLISQNAENLDVGLELEL